MSGPLSTNAPFNNFGQTMILRDIEQLYLLVGERNGDMGDAGYGTSSVGQYGPGSDLKGPNKGVKNPSTAGGSIVKYLGTLDVPVFGGSISVAGSAAGVGAVDWQQFRGTSAQVASGAYSIIAGGSNNTAAGIGSTILGGSNNTVLTNFSIAGGYNCYVDSGGSNNFSLAIGYNQFSVRAGSVALGYSPSSVNTGFNSISINTQVSTPDNCISIGGGSDPAQDGDICIIRPNSTASSTNKLIIGGTGTFPFKSIVIGDSSGYTGVTAGVLIGGKHTSVTDSRILATSSSFVDNCTVIGGNLNAVNSTYKPKHSTHIGPPFSGGLCANLCTYLDTVTIGAGYTTPTVNGFNKSLIYAPTLNGAGGGNAPELSRSILLQCSEYASWGSSVLTNTIRIWDPGTSTVSEFGGSISGSTLIGGWIQKIVSYTFANCTISNTVSLTSSTIVRNVGGNSSTITINGGCFLGYYPTQLARGAFSNSNGGSFTQTDATTLAGSIIDSNTTGCVAIRGELGASASVTTISDVVVIHGRVTANETGAVVAGCDWNAAAITNSIKVILGNVRANNLGCNGKAPQAASSVPSAVALTAGATYTATEQVMLGDLKAVCNSLRTALINNGICV